MTCAVPRIRRAHGAPELHNSRCYIIGVGSHGQRTCCTCRAGQVAARDGARSVVMHARVSRHGSSFPTYPGRGQSDSRGTRRSRGGTDSATGCPREGKHRRNGAALSISSHRQTQYHRNPENKPRDGATSGWSALPANASDLLRDGGRSRPSYHEFAVVGVLTDGDRHGPPRQHVHFHV
jgi:hypothetical protein